MSEYCYWECSGDPDHEPPWKGSCGGQSYEIVRNVWMRQNNIISEKMRDSLLAGTEEDE